MNWNTVLIFSFIFLFSSCGLLNSGTVHVKYNEFKAEIDDVLYENNDRMGDLSVSIRNVQHPSKFGKWNLNFKLSPSIHLERHTLGTLEHRVKDGVYEKYPDIKMVRFSSLGNFKLTAHTGIGIFAATVGFGGAVTKIESPDRDSSYRTTEIRKVDFVYYKFLTRRVFILLGPRYYKEQFEQFTFAFRLGYFWGRT